MFQIRYFFGKKCNESFSNQIWRYSIITTMKKVSKLIQPFVSAWLQANDRKECNLSTYSITRK